MITAQDVRDVKFTKSLGGYKTTEVDDFLDQCAAALDTLNAEKEELTRKTQVLAETVVDYREQEDNIRDALLGAQRLSDSIVKEARKNAENIVADAEHQSETMLKETEDSIEAEKAELVRIRTEVVNFKAKLLAIYREHLTLIDVLDADIPDEVKEEAEEAESVAEEQPIETVEDEISDHPAAELIEEAEETAPIDEGESAAPVAEPESIKLDLDAFVLDD